MRSLLTLLCIALMVVQLMLSMANADTTKLTSKPDALNERREVIRDRKGQAKAFSMPDALHPDRRIVRALDGSPIGYTKPDALNRKRTLIIFKTGD